MSVRRPWAWPLVPFYGAALAAKEVVRSAGLSAQQRLSWPVISVGSVSAGGAGKTPLVIALANLLSERGWGVDVLSRGYRRSGRGVERVDLLAAEPATRFGDEPTLIAERTGVPVWVGTSRYAAGAEVERLAMAGASHPGPLHPGPLHPGPLHSGPLHSGPDDSADGETEMRVHLLDDGFQHRSLARGFDMVLVTAADLEDKLLPAGNLREPLSVLGRADALVVRESELPFVDSRLRAFISPEVPLWTLRRALRFPSPLGVFGAGLRPLAFCALARPEGFAAMLANAGCGVVDTVIFSDHHRYTEANIKELIGLARRLGATGLVTTEKDAVKLSVAMRARLEDAVGSVMVVALDAHFVYESPVVRLLEARVGPAAPPLDMPREVRTL